MIKTTQINGRSVSYRERPASGNGLNVLLVHGATDHSWIWHHQLQAMPARHRCVAPDLPGRISSDGPPIDNAADFRDFIVAFVDHLQWDQFVLCGHSMGGSIALDFALNHPGRLLGFAMVASSPSWEMDPAHQELLRAQPREALPRVVEEFGDVFSKHTGRQVRAEMESEALKVPPETGASDLLACSTFMLDNQLGAVTCPALVVCGDEDPGSLPGSQRCGQQIPGAKFQLIERSGHSIMIEQPDVLNRALNDFVESLG